MSEELLAEIRRSFSEGVEPVRKSPFYMAGLFVVAMVMAILPVVYASIVAGAGYLLYYHAVHNSALMSTGVGMRFRLLVYFGPLIIGGILVVFMAIPLIPRFGKREKPLHVVTPEDEPVFYEWIEQICRAVGSPRPREIHLIMEPNAYAAFRRGIFSFMGNDLVLAIGMPLISSLTIRQLSGVVAHEMGHFSQGFGMRMRYLIECVNMWFVKAIYGGQGFEEKLGDLGEESGGSVGLILVLSRLFILMTKGVLWVFMMLGYLVSHFFSRQMEYDADMYEIQVGGSKDFEITMYSLTFLEIGWARTFQKSIRSVRGCVLAEDLPAFVKAEAKLVAQEHKEDIINTVLAANTHVFDTHPSCRDRIVVSKRKPMAGICKVLGSAKSVFSDYEGLSKRLTREFYNGKLAGLKGCRLLPVGAYMEYYEQHRYELEVRG